MSSQQHDMLVTGDIAKWEAAQKRAFAHWVNSMLKRREIQIDDIMNGFISGVNLIHLVEILTGKPLSQRWAKNPSLRVHKINNCFMALAHLKENGVKNLTVAAEDFVNGDCVNMVLGFCWQLLRHFQTVPSSGEGDGIQSFEQGLLAWVQSILKSYNDIDLSRGFKSESFQNGKVILGLINEYGEGLVDYKSYGSQQHQWNHNCKSGLEIAEAKMGIPNIIDHEELAAGKCGEKQLVLYLSLMYNAYKEKNLGMTTESLMKRIKELEEKLRLLTEENHQLKEALKHMDLSHAKLKTTFSETTEENRVLKVKRDELSSKYNTLEESYEADKLKWEAELARLRAQKAKLAANSDSRVHDLTAQWDAIHASRDKIREEFKKAKEELSKQKEELDAENKKLVAKLDRATKTKELLEQLASSQEATHKQVIVILRKHLLQHITDTNIWVPILELERQYKHQEVKVPKEGELSSLPWEKQLLSLINVVTDENKSFYKLIREREVEEGEVLSVNMGKLKKRVKKVGPGLETTKEGKPEKSLALGDKLKSPRTAGKSPRPDTAPPSRPSSPTGHSKKSDRK